MGLLPRDYSTQSRVENTLTLPVQQHCIHPDKNLGSEYRSDFYQQDELGSAQHPKPSFSPSVVSSRSPFENRGQPINYVAREIPPETIKAPDSGLGQTESAFERPLEGTPFTSHISPRERRAALYGERQSTREISISPVTLQSNKCITGSAVGVSNRRGRKMAREKHLTSMEQNRPFETSQEREKRADHNRNEHTRRVQESEKRATLAGLLPSGSLDSKMGNSKPGHTKIGLLDATIRVLKAIDPKIRDEQWQKAVEKEQQLPAAQQDVGSDAGSGFERRTECTCGCVSESLCGDDAGSHGESEADLFRLSPVRTTPESSLPSPQNGRLWRPIEDIDSNSVWDIVIRRSEGQL